MSYGLINVIKSGRSVIGYTVRNEAGQIAQLDKQTVEKLAINKEVYGVKAQHYKDKILLRDDGISISDLPVINTRNDLVKPQLEHVNITERSMARNDIDNQLHNKADKVKKLKAAVITYTQVSKDRQVPSTLRIHTNELELRDKIEKLTFPNTSLNKKVYKSTREHENGTIYQYAYVSTDIKDQMNDIINVLNSIGIKPKLQMSHRAINVDTLNYSEKVKATMMIRQVALTSNNKLDLISFKEQMFNIVSDYIIDIDDEITISDRQQGVKEYAIALEFNTGRFSEDNKKLYDTLYTAIIGLSGRNLQFDIEDVAVESDDETLSRKEQIDILKYFGLLPSNYKDPELGEEYTGEKVKLKNFIITKKN